MGPFKLWCWRRLLRVPWTIRRSNQSILKEINTEYLWERLMLKLKLQYFGHLMQRAHSLEDSDVGGDCGQEEKGATEDEIVGWHHWFNGHGLGQTLRSDEGLGSLVCYSSWVCKELDMTWWPNEDNNYRSLREKGQEDVTRRDTSGRVMWIQRQRLDTCSPKPRNSKEYQWPKTKKRHGKEFFLRASKSEANTLISTFWPPQLWENKFLLI